MSLALRCLGLLLLAGPAQASPSMSALPKLPPPPGPAGAPGAGPSVVLEPPPPAPRAAPAPLNPKPFAIGLGMAVQRRQDYGSLTRNVFIPELLGFHYRPAFRPRLHWRFGGRLGYAGLGQAEYPEGLQVTERDLRVASEAGLVYDNVVVPSLTTGVGLQYRKIDFSSELPGVDVSSLSNTELAPFVYLQAGAGISIARGLIVLEPYLRYEGIARDQRSGLMYGLDLSVELR